MTHIVHLVALTGGTIAGYVIISEVRTRWASVIDLWNYFHY